MRTRWQTMQTIKHPFWLLMLVSVSLTVSGRDIETLNGKVYRFAEVVKTDPGGIFIRYASGIHYIHFTNLPPEIRSEFNYSPAKARAFFLEKQRQEAAAELKRLEDERKSKIKNARFEFSKLLKDEVAAADFWGTGFFISSDGYLITSYHVIENARAVRIASRTKIQNAQLFGKNVEDDLAVLKVDGPHAALAIRNPRTINVGQTVIAIGFPNIHFQGLSPKVTDGIISGKRGFQSNRRDYQISVPIQSGNSGGPLLDHYGNVVGVIKSGVDWYRTGNGISVAQSINYAVKSRYILELLKSLKKTAPVSLVRPKKKPLGIDQVFKEARESIVLVLVHAK